jgi:hypothetical protein
MLNRHDYCTISAALFQLRQWSFMRDAWTVRTFIAEAGHEREIDVLMVRDGPDDDHKILIEDLAYKPGPQHLVTASHRLYTRPACRPRYPVVWQAIRNYYEATIYQTPRKPEGHRQEDDSRFHLQVDVSEDGRRLNTHTWAVINATDIEDIKAWSNVLLVAAHVAAGLTSLAEQRQQVLRAERLAQDIRIDEEIEAGTRLPFDDWLAEADDATVARTGVSLHDLADADYRGMWEDGLTPGEAALAVLEDNGFDFEGEALDIEEW